EVYYRAGGLVPIHPILHEPLMLHEGAVQSSINERKNDYAERVMQEQDIKEQDVIFVISTSARNPVPVDVAKMAKQKGAYALVITSIGYSDSQPSQLVGGEYLVDSDDSVIDKHAQGGDALLSDEKVDIDFAPSSAVVGASILYAVLAEYIKHIADAGF